MNSAAITAIINVVTALIPTITQATSTLFGDAQALITAATQSDAVTPAQLELLATQAKVCDAAQDAAYAAYQALTAGQQDGG